MADSFTVAGRVVDILAKTTTPAEVTVERGHIAAITPVEAVPADAGFLLPGFIDAHVHIESSML
ncbi:MAG: hypothetical protein KDA44_19705, partial [Planctomycetales bacterium]|nr:hypothetical protein [Planctomycetales bacterium]